MKDHIEQLEDMVKLTNGSTYTEAFRAAVDLMRAAEPKDPAGEREHCAEYWQRISDGVYQTGVDVFAEARAAVRAECAARLQTQVARADKQHHRAMDAEAQLSAAQAEIAQAQLRVASLELENETQEAQLSAAQAELEHERALLRGMTANLSAAQAEAQTDHDLLVGVVSALETKLSTAQAEIERLRRFDVEREAQVRYALSKTHDVETKLTNLRTAASQYLAYQADPNKDTPTNAVFRDAIEASR